MDLNATVSNMHDLLQTSVGSRVRLRTALEPGLRRALVDPTQIELVVLNLAINARDAMEVGGTLRIETANAAVPAAGRPRRAGEPEPGEYVTVAVSDTGTGMAPEVLAKAFEPFFTTKPVGKGSGLGLAQVYGFAKQSGGGVRIDTELGRGTTVRVFLPRAAALAAGGAEGDAAPAPRPGRAARDGGGPRTVLLVDDDGAVREVAATILRNGGHEVVEAGSGGAALEALAALPRVDLMVLDFAMPGMNGAEVAREARARRPGLPVLFVTGYADLAAVAALEARDIIGKPFTEAEFAEKVAAAMARGARGGGADRPTGGAGLTDRPAARG
jgi:CheY-like chemotaxis protein